MNIIKVTCVFLVSIGLIEDVREEFEFEFPEGTTQEFMDKYINEEYIEWRWDIVESNSNWWYKK